MLDLKISGGRVVGGSGNNGYVGDIGIRDGRIVAVRKIDEDAHASIDATGGCDNEIGAERPRTALRSGRASETVAIPRVTQAA